MASSEKLGSEIYNPDLTLSQDISSKTKKIKKKRKRLKKKSKGSKQSKKKKMAEKYDPTHVEM